MNCFEKWKNELSIETAISLITECCSIVPGCCPAEDSCGDNMVMSCHEILTNYFEKEVKPGE